MKRSEVLKMITNKMTGYSNIEAAAESLLSQLEEAGMTPPAFVDDYLQFGWEPEEDSNG
jgi:hypothetical protein